MLSFCLWLLFIILSASFQVQISLIYPFLAYMVSTYCLPSNTGFIVQGNEDFSPMFSSRSFIVLFSSVQWLSHVWLFASPWTAACQASLSITNSESTQTHVHRISDAIQPSHPLLSPSPPTFNLSQHQGLFQRVASSHQMAKVLEFQLQHQSFQWTFRTDFL